MALTKSTTTEANRREHTHGQLRVNTATQTGLNSKSGEFSRPRMGPGFGLLVRRREKMKKLLCELIKILFDEAKNILPTFSTVFIYILILIITFLGKERIIKGKYLHFKKIRKDYLKDKINGYFALKQYFSRSFSTDEMDYIINSPKAYEIFLFLKNGRKKCEFKENKYTTNVTRCNYILPVIGYAISYILLAFQIFFCREILATEIDLHDFLIILIVNVCINGPLLITSLMSISEIADARKLAKVTNGEKKKETKCFLSCFKSCLLRCKNAKEKTQKKTPCRKSVSYRFWALIINPTNRRNVCPHVCGNVCLIKCFGVCRRKKR